ncbi:MAG: S-methyl-5-thioribose-1-phosphate isomerase [Blastocatellia bacterium]|nr:S-methyl-5-thioribose-1-phosphate isomerase [Blastocatellia bacterium]
MIKTIEWTDAGVVMIDQKRLPNEEVYPCFSHYREIAGAIKDMTVRGAPAIGVAAAMGIALGAKAFEQEDHEVFANEFEQICREFAATRPTAVNLFWAIDQMKLAFEQAFRDRMSVAETKKRLVERALEIHRADIAANEQMGKYGAPLLPDSGVVLTHCNAGALATAGYGTALGVIRAAKEIGKNIEVYADETRPFLQGARLTCWELAKDNIGVTLITDNMSGHFMKMGRIKAVIVGADRIASNGDVANKIGTYMVAVLAKENNIPFYVAAPVSTLDPKLSSGEQIPIEDRASTEITEINGRRVAPVDIAVANPAFDVTPNKYVTAIITERGVAYPPYTESLKQFFD